MDNNKPSFFKQALGLPCILDAIPWETGYHILTYPHHALGLY